MPAVGHAGCTYFFLVSAGGVLAATTFLSNKFLAVFVFSIMEITI